MINITFAHRHVAQALRRWAGLFLLLLCWLGGPAQAANYVFPGTLPAGCTRSGSSANYTCGNVTLAYGDTITINSPTPANVTVNGNFTTDTNQINAAGSAANLVLSISGTLTLGYNPTIKANITANGVTDNGGQASITGTLTSSGNISLGYKTNISGDITATGTASITLSQDAVYGGNITSNSGAIGMGQNAQIAGSISSTSGAVTVAQGAKVTGGIGTGGAVSLNFGAQVSGNITAGGAVTVAQSAVASGNITATTGLVDLQYGSQVTGTITTTSGNIQVAQSAKALACVKSTTPGTITLGYQAQVNSVCCGNSCTSSCVVNNSNGAMPPLCSPSTPAVDHYELSLPSTGINCLPVTATVTACANSSSPCNSAATTVNGKTATLGTNAGTLGATTITFNASGVASTTLSNTNPSSAVVTLSGEQVAGNNPRKCCPDGINCAAANSCTTAFSQAGFVIAASAGGAALTSLPAQVAGISSTGGSPSSYYLRSVNTNNSTKACEAALTGSNIDVKWAVQCNNPAACSSGNKMSLTAGTGATAVNSNPIADAATGGSTTVTMGFDVNGNAPFNFNYADVGLVTLQASRPAGGAQLVPLSGSSTVVVKPAGFTVTNVIQTVMPPTVAVVNQATLPLPVGKTLPDRFVKAGEAFTATITAVTSGGLATPNYGKETSPYSPYGVVLTPSLVLPTSGNGNPGTLANATPTPGNTGVSLSNGAITTTTLGWSEVGIMSLVPEVPGGSYLGATVAPFNKTTGPIGRFVPDHFAVAIDTAATMGCSTNTPFTYFGQDGVTTKFSVAAQNSANGPTRNYTPTPFTVTTQNPANGATLNYSGYLAKLDLTSYTALGFTARVSPSGAALPAGAAPGAGAVAPSGSWPVYDINNSGVAIVTARHIISRPSVLTTETSAVLNAAPNDGEVPVAAAGAISGGAKLRWGRLVLQNAFGTDQLDLPMPLLAQYYVTSGGLSGFTTNTDDSCTTLAASNVNLVNYQGGLTAGNMPVANVTVNPPTGKLVSGVGKVVLQKPATRLSAIGSVDVLLHLGDATTVPVITTATCPTATPASPLGTSLLAGTAPNGTSYLATNSCAAYSTNSSSFNVNPGARATLGGYKSPVIFQRENY